MIHGFSDCIFQQIVSYSLILQDVYAHYGGVQGIICLINTVFSKLYPTHGMDGILELPFFPCVCHLDHPSLFAIISAPTGWLFSNFRHS